MAKKGILQETGCRLLWRPQSPRSRLWKKKRMTLFPTGTLALSPCEVHHIHTPSNCLVPSFLHLWHHCLCQEGCGLQVNVQNLKWREKEKEHQGRAGEGRAMRTYCLLGLVQISDGLIGPYKRRGQGPGRSTFHQLIQLENDTLGSGEKERNLVHLVS